MSFPITPPLVLAALLTAGPAAGGTTVEPTEPSPEPPPAAVDAVATSAASSCPAYLGPQCDTTAHEHWADGQALADLHAHRRAA